MDLGLRRCCHLSYYSIMKNLFSLLLSHFSGGKHNDLVILYGMCQRHMRPVRRCIMVIDIYVYDNGKEHDSLSQI